MASADVFDGWVWGAVCESSTVAVKDTAAALMALPCPDEAGVISTSASETWTVANSYWELEVGAELAVEFPCPEEGVADADPADTTSTAANATWTSAFEVALLVAGAVASLVAGAAALLMAGAVAAFAVEPEADELMDAWVGSTRVVTAFSNA